MYYSSLLSMSTTTLYSYSTTTRVEIFSWFPPSVSSLFLFPRPCPSFPRQFVRRTDRIEFSFKKMRVTYAPGDLI